MNLANILTISRIILVPFFIYCLLQPENEYKIAAFIMFSIAALTDLVDGYIARKFKQETELGKFLDPLADKLLVVAALIVFLILEKQIQLWMVLVIVMRDMLVTVMRYIAVKKGSSLRTSVFGKIKTAFQMISLVIILIIFIVRNSNVADEVNSYYEIQSVNNSVHAIASERFIWANSQKFENIRQVFGLYSYSLPYFLLLLTTIFTAWSGLRYLYTNYQLFLPPYPKLF